MSPNRLCLAGDASVPHAMATILDGRCFHRCCHYPSIRLPTDDNPTCLLSDAQTFILNHTETPKEHLALIVIRVVVPSAREVDLLHCESCMVPFFFDTRDSVEELFELARNVLFVEHDPILSESGARGVFNDDFEHHSPLDAVRGMLYDRPMGTPLFSGNDTQSVADSLESGVLRYAPTATDAVARVDYYKRCEHRSTLCTRHLEKSETFIEKICQIILGDSSDDSEQAHATFSVLEHATSMMRSIRTALPQMDTGSCAMCTDTSQKKGMLHITDDAACTCLMEGIVTGLTSRIITLAFMPHMGDAVTATSQPNPNCIPRFFFTPTTCTIPASQTPKWHRAVCGAMYARGGVPATQWAFSAKQIMEYALSTQLRLWTINAKTFITNNHLIINTLMPQAANALRYCLSAGKPDAIAIRRNCLTALVVQIKNARLAGAKTVDDATRHVYRSMQRNRTNRRFAVSLLLAIMVPRVRSAKDFCRLGWTALLLLTFISNCDAAVVELADHNARLLEEDEVHRRVVRHQRTEKRRQRRQRSRLNRQLARAVPKVVVQLARVVPKAVVQPKCNESSYDSASEMSEDSMETLTPVTPTPIESDVEIDDSPPAPRVYATPPPLPPIHEMLVPDEAVPQKRERTFPVKLLNTGDEEMCHPTTWNWMEEISAW